MNGKPPAFQFYARDWLADAKVRRLQLDERGAYCDLLCVQWNEGRIPQDCDEAGMCIGIRPDTWTDWRSRIWPNVRPFFPRGRNRRLHEYRLGLAKKREGLSDAGKLGAAKRWGKDDIDGQAIARPMAIDSTAVAVAPAVDCSVPTEPADAERWNDFLAPSCRTVGGDEHLSDWLGHWAKCGARNSTMRRDRAAETMWGLRWLADKGQLEDTYGVRKGDTMKPAILRSPRADILARNALEAYQRHAPNAGTEILRKLEAI